MTQAALAQPPRLPHPPSPPRDFLKEVKTGGSGLPNRVVLHGVEGVGKTSFGAQAPKPIFGMARGETGLETLIDSGRLSETPHFPEWESWEDVLASVRQLTEAKHDYRSLVIDTLNGVERLCHEHVCRRDYNNDWSEGGFIGFMRGFDTAIADWRELLGLLDALRSKRQMSILGLVHTRVAPFKNPTGADFDRFVADMHHKTWGLTHKWADMVLFATFFTETKKAGGRHKGVGGQERILFTERHAAYDAKNRQGLPELIHLGRTPAEGWGNFREALKEASAGGEGGAA